MINIQTLNDKYPVIKLQIDSMNKMNNMDRMDRLIL